MFENYKNEIIEYLQKKSIDIKESSYKKSEKFFKIRNTHIWVKNFCPMPIEEYIERYLLSKKEVTATYESIYDMGSPVAMDQIYCNYKLLANEIIKNIELDKKEAIEEIAITRNLKRKKTGLIARLKKYLNFDIDLFYKDNMKDQREIFKILYFFYTMENSDNNKKRRNKKVLLLLSKYSMENIDGYFINKNTYNGTLIKGIKNSLEKELNLASKEKIRNSLIKIQTEWNAVLERAYTSTHVLEEKLSNAYLPARIDNLMNLLRNVKYKECVEYDGGYKHSPIETLYLKVLQSEYLSYAKDFIFINDIRYDLKCIASVDFVKEMKTLRENKVSIKDIASKINYQKIAQFVYLKSKITKTERERVQDNISKIKKLYGFFKRNSKAQFDNSGSVDELFIVSCLQAIILDKNRKEIFDYTFHAYQEEASTRKPTVQGALLRDKKVYEALKYYWIRRVMDRWYSNCGMLKIKEKFRELEKIFNDIQIKILKRANVDEMLDLHNYYITKVIGEFGLYLMQCDYLSRFEEFLKNEGFKYIDKNYVIRYIFVYSNNIEKTYDELVSRIFYWPELVMFYNFKFEDRQIEMKFELEFDRVNNTCTMKNFERMYDTQYIQRLKNLGIVDPK